MKHQQSLTAFCEELATLTREVESSVAMGRLDIGIICEAVVCDLLKNLYSLPHLRNLNEEEKKNFPAIDLADDQARVAIQVTASSSLAKIKTTLTKFLDHGLHERYDKLIVYVLTTRQASYSQKPVDELLNQRFKFDTATNIWDYRDLAEQAGFAKVEALGKSLDALRSYTRGVAESDALAYWEPITFDKTRGLGPALMGRGLGPSDAEACPRLQEVGLIVSQLDVAYSVRIVGAPGAGKSLCAYQVGNALSKKGRRVYRLKTPQAECLEFLDIPDDTPCIYLIDDAHLITPGIVKRLEERADEANYVLSTFNAVQTKSTHRDVVAIDGIQAVQTIATSLRATPTATLAAVRRADNQVGEHYGDIQLNDRIDEAATAASYPWQFCFVLGGGWRRSDQVAHQARDAGYDLVLTAICLRQLASRDAALSLEDLARLCRLIEVPKDRVADAVTWLQDKRLVISSNDIRCPHQRFASVLLGKIFERFKDDANRQHFITLFRVVITDDSVPMIGAYMVMDGVRFADSLRWRLKELLDAASVEKISNRCWSAQSALDRSNAAFVLEALDQYTDDWPRKLLESNKPTLVNWMNEARSSEGYGLARLMNNIWNDDKEFAREIVADVSPESVAQATSLVVPEFAYSIAELIDRIVLAASTKWRQKFREELDNKNMVKLAATWPDLERLFVLSKFCNAISHFDEELALEMVVAATPDLQRSFEKDPIGVFEQLGDILGGLLRVWDPLGVYKGVLSATGRKRAMARRLFSRLDASQFASTLSSLRLRDFEPAARLLSVVRDLLPRLVDKTSAEVDWSAIETTVAREWDGLSHGTVTLFCQLSLSRSGEDQVPALLLKNADQIKVMDTRLAIVAPDAAFAVVDSGQSVALCKEMTFGWTAVAYVIHLFGEQRPDLLPALLKPHESVAAAAFGKDQANTFHGVDTFLKVLQEYAPDSVDRILVQVSPEEAAIAWRACLRSDTKARRSAAALVQASIDHGGKIGALGEELRRRYPSASVPSNSGKWISQRS